MDGSYLGYALIGVGIAIILLALLLGYGVYSSANGDLNSLALIGTGSGSSTVNGSISALTANLQSTATVGTYTAIEVIVLFLFASIGYKIAYLGVQMNRQGGGGAAAKQSRMKE